MANNTPVIIKKYSNRRLYDTQTSTYITLDTVRDMVRNEIEFQVRDAKSGEDLTRQVLTQIIFEQELSGTQNMLPVNFLKKLIGLYDNNMQEVFPHYLDGSMEAFTANQDKIREHMQEFWSDYNPIDKLESMQRQNLKIMQDAMQMFNPFEYMKPPKS